MGIIPSTVEIAVSTIGRKREMLASITAYQGCFPARRGSVAKTRPARQLLRLAVGWVKGCRGSGGGTSAAR
jgi:hypothetical protein